MGAIYLIRHGQASFGKSDYDALSELGFEQARVLGESLRSRVARPDGAYSGSMRRHRETGTACLEALGHALPLSQVPGFNEYDHEQIVERYRPAYANRDLMMAQMAQAENPRRAFQEMFTQAIARWVSGRHDREYAESWVAFRARCVHALDELIAQLGASKTALVFTSGGPITAIAQGLLRIADADVFNLNWTLANCGITKIVYSDRGKYLATLNEHVCFEGARQNLITYR